MKNAYIQQGNTFRAVDTDAFGIHEKLPVGTYTINETPLGFAIARIEDMSAPGKLYGDVDARAARILSTFEDRPNSTGGSGVVWNCRDRGVADEPLYALPGAKGE